VRERLASYKEEKQPELTKEEKAALFLDDFNQRVAAREEEEYQVRGRARGRARGRVRAKGRGGVPGAWLGVGLGVGLGLKGEEEYQVRGTV